MSDDATADSADAADPADAGSAGASDGADAAEGRDPANAAGSESLPSRKPGHGFTRTPDTEVPAAVQTVDEGLPNDELSDDETIVRDTAAS